MATKREVFMELLTDFYDGEVESAKERLSGYQLEKHLQFIEKQREEALRKYDEATE